MAWLTASQALDILGVLPQTLYANVSRGKIRAKPDPKESHRSLYHSEDVERMAGRNAGKRRAAGKPAHNPAGSVAPDSGCPPSEAPAPAVSCVWGGRLWYRGRDAVELADTASLEQTAALLWNTEPPVFLVNPERDYSPAPGETGMLAAFHLLSRRAVRDLPFSGRSRVLWIREAIELVGDLIEVFTGSPIPATKRALHWHLGWAWGVPGSQDVLRRTLVLLADDDSCAPAVAARAAVSNGTSPAAALLVGLACWTGSFRNGAAARIDDLKTRALERDAAAAVGDYLRRGEPAPGFGHPGFPGGDPRAAALLERFQPNDVFARLLEEGTALTGLRPNMDLTLAALAASLGLPDQAPFVLSVLARSTGWIAHALEQAGLGAVAATE